MAKAERAKLADEKNRKLQAAKEAAEKAEEDRLAAEKAKQAEVLAGTWNFLTSLETLKKHQTGENNHF